MITFEEIGNMSITDIPDPPLLPIGTYLVVITAQPEVRDAATGNKGWKFPLCFLQARDDVDMQDLATALAASQSKLTDVKIDDTFWVTEKSAYLLRNFFMNVLGFTSGTINQCVAESYGKQYLATLRHTMRRDGTGLIAEITRRAPAPQQ
jgi:hypothetical protein